MLKLVGGLLLALTGVVLAVSIYRFEQKKLRVIDAFISLIFHIKGQIDCYSLPLCDIMQNRPTDLELPRGTGDFFELLSHSKIYLDAEAYRLLERFYLEFGSLYREEQLKRCDYYIEALTEQRRMLFAGVKDKGRAGSALWICAGICAIILLW